jgi:hypothetical protein
MKAEYFGVPSDERGLASCLTESGLMESEDGAQGDKLVVNGPETSSTTAAGHPATSLRQDRRRRRPWDFGVPGSP